MRYVITFVLSLAVSFPLLADEIVIAVVKGLDYPPYFWRDSQTGRRDGYLPDLHGQLLAALGYSVRYHEYDPRQPESWQRVMGGLNDGSIDVIGGITDLQKSVPGVTPIKAPLFKAQMAIFARKENLQQLSGLPQLKGRVGAFGLYNAPLVLSEDIERHKLQAKSYRQYHEAYQWLINKEVDYWVADIFAAKAYLYRFDRPHQVATEGQFFLCIRFISACQKSPGIVLLCQH